MNGPAMWLRRVVLICLVSSGCCEVFYKGLNRSDERYSFISEKIAQVIEKATSQNISLAEGLALVRNDEPLPHRQARLLGFDRLKQATENFLRSHVISLELGGARKMSRDSGFMGFGGFGGGFNKKALKKERKYIQYAFMVLLGIFGLTGPLVMKVLAMMAAKSLLAAKAALIIVGSVTLKKLFEKDNEKPSVKVHTINHDDDGDHDRIGFGLIDHYSLPYRSYYDDYSAKLANKMR